MRRFRHYLEDVYHQLEVSRKSVFVDAFRDMTAHVLLGAGFSDGDLTTRVAKQLGGVTVVGVDIDTSACKQGRQKSFLVAQANLDNCFPVRDSSIDVISADQVIEHLVDPDTFLAEAWRVLSPDGRLVLCTEKLAAWHNIVALLFGFQAFSQQVSRVKQLGNPFSLHYSEAGWNAYPRHHFLFTYRGLRDILELHHFRVEKLLGIGYLPFGPSLARMLARTDPRHAYFLLAVARKRPR